MLFEHLSDKKYLKRFTGVLLELKLELESNLHSNTIKIVNNLEMLRSAVQDIQISQKTHTIADLVRTRNI